MSRPTINSACAGIMEAARYISTVTASLSQSASFTGGSVESSCSYDASATQLFTRRSVLASNLVNTVKIYQYGCCPSPPSFVFQPLPSDNPYVTPDGSYTQECFFTPAWVPYFGASESGGGYYNIFEVIINTRKNPTTGIIEFSWNVCAAYNGGGTACNGSNGGWQTLELGSYSASTVTAYNGDPYNPPTSFGIRTTTASLTLS